MTLPLSYVFDPGAERDGVTVHVPLKSLPQLKPIGFDWLVPALRPELVTALIRSLPKELRRSLVPVPEVAAAALERMRPRSEPLLDALGRELEALRGVRIPREAWGVDRLPPHLRMTFRVEDERGALVAEGSDLDALREQVRPRLRQELAGAAAPLERHGLTSWTHRRRSRRPSRCRAPARPCAAIPRSSTRARPSACACWRRRRRSVRRCAPARASCWRSTSPRRSATCRARCATRTCSRSPARRTAAPAPCSRTPRWPRSKDSWRTAGGPAWDEAGFARLRDHVAGNLADATARAVRDAVAILDAARDVERALEPLARAPALAPAREDVERQLRRLVPPGFIAATGVRRLPDVERYLRAAARRLERLPNAPAPDLDRMRGVQELEREYEARVASWPAGRPLPQSLREVPWLLEELRVAHFAQSLGTRGQVSAKRIRKVIEQTG